MEKKTKLYIMSLFAIIILLMGALTYYGLRKIDKLSQKDESLNNLIGAVDKKTLTTKEMEKYFNDMISPYDKRIEELKDTVIGFNKEIEGFNKEIEGYNKEIEGFNKEIEGMDHYLNERIDSVDSELSFLSINILSLRSLVEKNDSAIFNINDFSGFSAVNTDNGIFFISIEDVQPYLSGYKIMLDIGNPQNCRYRGLKLNVKWSKEFDSENKDISYTDWKKAINEKDMSFSTVSLEAGEWTTIEVVMSPVELEEMGYIEFSVYASTVALKQGK